MSESLPPTPVLISDLAAEKLPPPHSDTPTAAPTDQISQSAAPTPSCQIPIPPPTPTISTSSVPITRRVREQIGKLTSKLWRLIRVKGTSTTAAQPPTARLHKNSRWTSKLAVWDRTHTYARKHEGEHESAAKKKDRERLRRLNRT